jgi:membrane-associated phospholipid phosphatase
VRFSDFRKTGTLVSIALIYLTVASGIMIWRGISVSPDYILLLLVPIALISGHFIWFLRDWVPFIAIFLAYEAMRGIAPKLGLPPHVGDLANIESTLFGGHIPSAVLQSLTPSGPGQTVIEYVATIVYFSHFIVPLGVGFTLWLVNRTQYLRYTTALLGMALAAFIVFLLIPTAPPWYAEDQGIITGVEKIISTTLPSDFSPFYKSLNPNPVAAFPSLHAGFPFLSFLALRPVFPRASWIAFAWCIVVWVSVVYLGEHYVIDVIGGIAWAGLSWFVLMRYVVPRVHFLQRHATTLPMEEDAAVA